MLLEVRDLCKHYGGVVALHNVCLSVREKEIFAVIGPNGAGKTTLFNVIAGAVRPDGGRVYFGGSDITGKRPHQLARMGIARTFQNLNLFSSMTVLDNVLTGTPWCTGAAFWPSLFARSKEGGKKGRGEAMLVLEKLGLLEEADLPVGRLSPGRQRRVGLARALASKPSLLLLDEPTAGLTPDEMGELAQCLAGLRDEGTTIVLVEHNMEVVMGLADRVLVMDCGKVVTCGTPEQVSTSPDVIRVYLGGEECVA